MERQLHDKRLGDLSGKLTVADLNHFLIHPEAQYFFDARSQHINVIRWIGHRYLRITTLRDKFKIISVGPMNQKQLCLGVQKGRFTPILSQPPLNNPKSS